MAPAGGPRKGPRRKNTQKEKKTPFQLDEVYIRFVILSTTPDGWNENSAEKRIRKYVRLFGMAIRNSPVA